MGRALLVIDVQREYFDGTLPIRHPAGHLRSILQAMDAAKRASIPTVVVRDHQPDPESPIFRKGAELGQRLEPTIQLMALLRRSTRLPIVQLESPPPIPSEHIETHPAGFEELIPKFGVAPASLRYKLWRVHPEVVREACERLGMRFVPAPRSMQDADGC